MKLPVILIIVFCLGWIISMPYLKKFKIYQFCALIVMPFIISYLFYATQKGNDFSIRKDSFLFILLLGGWIYQAKKFYDKYLTEKEHQP